LGLIAARREALAGRGTIVVFAGSCQLRSAAKAAPGQTANIKANKDFRTEQSFRLRHNAGPLQEIPLALKPGMERGAKWKTPV
jgi:hypothetical protein